MTGKVLTRRALLACGLAVAATLEGCATASPLEAARPDLRGLPQAIESRVQQKRYPGAVYAVARGDRVIAVEAVGVADIDSGAPMRTDSIFQMMSMTKVVTAVAAMILVDEGKLDLDAPVSRYLPEFAGFGVEGAAPLTVRHLLTHTSGIGFGKIPSGETSLAAQASEIAARKMKVATGAVWAYSGVNGPDVVARVVEVVAGEPYDRFIKRRIFDPLKMVDTAYVLTPEQQGRLVGLYQAKDGQITKAPPVFPPFRYPSGGAGLYSTAPDFLRFTRMLANNGTLGSARVLSPKAVEELRRAQLPGGFNGLPPGIGAGLLMRRIVDPTPTGSPLPAGAYGWSGAYGTHFWIDPNTGLSAIWMINLTNAGGAGSADALDFERLVVEACKSDRRCGG